MDNIYSQKADSDPIEKKGRKIKKQLPEWARYVFLFVALAIHLGVCLGGSKALSGMNNGHQQGESAAGALIIFVIFLYFPALCVSYALFAGSVAFWLGENNFIKKNFKKTKSEKIKNKQPVVKFIVAIILLLSVFIFSFLVFWRIIVF